MIARNGHNGNGAGSGKNDHKIPPQAAPPAHEDRPSSVTFKTSAGVKLTGTPLNLNLHSVVFELYNPAAMPQLSESLSEFEIVLLDNRVYSGRALVCNVVDGHSKIVCEAVLEQTMWMHFAVESGPGGLHHLERDFRYFFAEWEKSFYVGADYKVVIAELHTFLADLQLWLDHVEASIRAAPEAEKASLEQEAVQTLRGPVISILTHMFGRFENLAKNIPENQVAAHRAFAQRLLHPFLLCAPFINRCFTKPLGFAGDYEMMNMIVRNRLEGASLFAKLTNQFLLDQIGPMAVRGRVDFLYSKIAAETGRMARSGNTANVFCVACGPAWEAVNFIAEHPLAEKARFDLLDFSEETLAYITNKVTQVKREHGRQTEVKFIRNAVQNLLRGKNKHSESGRYDLIYCSGLYDYLSDTVCKSLNTHLYDMLNPGGLLVVGNFAPNLPVRNFIEHFLEWFLIYRDAEQFRKLAPEQAREDDCNIRAETTGTNIFLEVRKPA